jgi:anaerobic magnesium-protoporphyrin IX monomethyl ester cyclase
MSLDVLFIEPNVAKEAYQALATEFSAIETPTWSLLLAQSCRSVGYSVAICDANAEHLTDEQTVKRVEELQPRLVVFVMYGQNPNSGTTMMIGAYRTGEKLKEALPSLPICMVGSHVSALPKEVLEKPFVDFVLLNEGVYALRNLLKTDLKSPSSYQLKDIKGIGYKYAISGTGCNTFSILNAPEFVVPQEKMDIDLPGYAWDLLPYKNKPFDLYRAHFWHANFDKTRRTPFASIYTSLGCRFGCDFCMINILNRKDNRENVSSADSRLMRFWSPNFITKEFEKLAGYGVETLRISDEMFFLDKRYFEPLLNNIVDRGLKFNMWSYARVDTVRKQYLELFKKAGVNWLALGIEAARQEIRLEVSKGTFKDINIRQVCQDIRDSDINVISNFIFGFPDDTKETMQATLDLALEINAETTNMYPCMALPGSPLNIKAKQEGWKLPSTPEGYAFLSYESEPLATKHCTSAEVLEFRDNAWHTYFTNPAYLSLVEKRFGLQQRKNVEEMAQIKLKRKLLGH